MPKVALIGHGYLGQAYAKVFPDAVIYDEPKGIGLRREVNECDLAIIAVPTEGKPNGKLDMSIIESIISWLDTPLILIKSALMPGTVDRLVKETGKKIAVSVEFLGQGNYYVPPHKYPDPKDPQKHQMIIVGGELDTATKCAEILWNKLSPDVRIHLLTAKEAELCKLIENAYGALKVTWINCLYDLITKSGGNFIRTHQAWSADGRVDGIHLRTTSFKRGWNSHCWNKDIQALRTYSEQIKEQKLATLLKTIIDLNRGHLEA